MWPPSRVVTKRMVTICLRDIYGVVCISPFAQLLLTMFWICTKLLSSKLEFAQYRRSERKSKRGFQFLLETWRRRREVWLCWADASKKLETFGFVYRRIQKILKNKSKYNWDQKSLFCDCWKRDVELCRWKWLQDLFYGRRCSAICLAKTMVAKLIYLRREKTISVYCWLEITCGLFVQNRKK